MKNRNKHLISVQHAGKCGRRVMTGAAAILAAAGTTVNAFASESSGITMAEAWFNTFLGVGTVFIMLIVMSIIIYCFRVIPMIQNKLTNKGQSEAQVKVSAPAIPADAPAADVTDDLELVAVIAAAIAASEQIPLDSFRVRTIKRRY